MPYFCGVITFVSVLCSFIASSHAQSSDIATLSGTWKVKHADNPEFQKIVDITDWKWTFDDSNNMTWTGGPHVLPEPIDTSDYKPRFCATYELVSTKLVKEITLTHQLGESPEDTAKGIYVLQTRDQAKPRMIICITFDPKKARPTSVDTAKRRGYYTFMLEKEFNSL